MKVCTANSSRFYASQVQRVEQGFVELGHTITPHAHEADLIYVNNPPFAQAIKDRAEGHAKGRIIGNVLDIPHHCADFNADALAIELGQVDAITSISNTTAHDLVVACGQDSEVVYQPIMPVTRAPLPRGDRLARFISCGRKWDGNKRFSLGVNALQLLGIPSTHLFLVGAEHGWGNYLGVLNEEGLDRVYNSVDFALVPTLYAGIELPIIEAMACGVIPVVCNDLWTRHEFLPPALFPEYDHVAPNAQSIARFIAQYLEDGDRMAAMKQRLHDHWLANWAEAFSPKGVAAAILRVYEGIA